MIDFSEWPVIDMFDFTHVEFDATKWSDDGYTLIINYYSVIAEKEGDHNSGMTICLKMAADNLEELHLKISALIALGMFDGLEIYGTGTIWNEDGDEIDEVRWNDFVLEIEDDELETEKEESDEDESPDDPLHHRPVKTIQ